MPFVESTVSICAIEEVAAATTRPPWFQLYVMRDRSYAEDLMAARAAVGARCWCSPSTSPWSAPATATPATPWSARPPLWAKLRRAFDLARHPAGSATCAIGGKPLTFGNLEKAVPGARTPEAFRDWVDAQFDPSVTWDDIAWVREHWDGQPRGQGRPRPRRCPPGRRRRRRRRRRVQPRRPPARRRALDRPALPGVVDAVGDQAEVLVDGGIRTGLDVVKVLALGARAGLIGRAWAWAVAARGEAGVAHVLEGLRPTSTSPWPHRHHLVAESPLASRSTHRLERRSQTPAPSALGRRGLRLPGSGCRRRPRGGGS